MGKRNHAFDFLCGICILRMLSLHTMEFCGLQSEAWWKEIMQWSYFFMSFFFFKAGYFNKSVVGPTLAYCKDKAKRLLIPYFTTGLIGFVIYFSFLPFLLNRYKNPIEPLSWDHIWLTSEWYGNAPTWFLFSFFSAYICIHFLEKARHRLLGGRVSHGVMLWSSSIYLLFPLLSYWCFENQNPVWLNLNNVPMGIFFFELGRVWRRVMERFGQEKTVVLSVVLILLFIAGNIIFHDASYVMSSNKFRGDFCATMFNTTVILCGLSGLLISVDLPRVPVINYIGQHSMVYFVGHYPILYYYKFTHLCFGYSIYGHGNHVLVLLPAIIMICSWLVPFIESTPWLSGRWPKKTV